VAHLSFTGSVAVGQLIQAAAAQNTIPVTLELGGKSPQIVFADADLDAALPFLVNAGIQNCGQTCSAASRILVERPVFDEVRRRMAERYAALRVGPAMDDLDVGPVISARQREIVQGFLAIARDTGLQVAAQARLPASLPAGGCYVPPTLLAPAGRPPPGAGGDLRPGAGDDPVRRRGRGAGDRQRHQLRPGGRRVDPRRRPPAAHGAQAAVRPGVHQQLRRRRRHRAAVRRRQALGPWPREGLRGAVRLLVAEDGGHQARSDSTWPAPPA
jgi:hypothetical protein